MKICVTCKEDKSLEDFYFDRTGNRHMSACKKCSSARSSARVRSERKIRYSRTWFSTKLYKIKKRAETKGLEFDLTIDFLEDFYLAIACIYCGENNQNVTIDRKDSNLGYTQSNCAPACFRCNAMKSNVYTYDEMLIIGKALAEIDAIRQKNLMVLL